MQKRKLRIVKEAGGIPLLGICERCNLQFPADPHKLGEAKATILARFDAHSCKLVDSSQNALRIVRESTEDR